jgi:hypothetical protein
MMKSLPTCCRAALRTLFSVFFLLSMAVMMPERVKNLWLRCSFVRPSPQILYIRLDRIETVPALMLCGQSSSTRSQLARSRHCPAMEAPENDQRAGDPRRRRWCYNCRSRRVEAIRSTLQRQCQFKRNQVRVRSSFKLIISFFHQEKGIDRARSNMSRRLFHNQRNLSWQRGVSGGR